MRKENISYTSYSTHSIESPIRDEIKLNYVQISDTESLEILSLGWFMCFLYMYPYNAQ